MSDLLDPLQTNLDGTEADALLLARLTYIVNVSIAALPDDIRETRLAWCVEHGDAAVGLALKRSGALEVWWCGWRLCTIGAELLTEEGLLFGNPVAVVLPVLDIDEGEGS